MIEDELVTETGIGDAGNSGGRKPILLKFNGKSALSISFDIGYDYIEGLFSFLDGDEIKSESKRKLKIDSTNVVGLIRTIVSDFEKVAPDTKHGIIGITLAIHGVIHQNKVVFTPYYDLDTMGLYEEISSIFPYSVYIENEANLTALGEYTFSSTFDSLISLSIHSGIGAGIVEDGKLQIGKHGKAGEIGHSILYPSGITCPCGNQGCLEQYASNKVLYDEFAKLKGLTHVNTQIIRDYYLKKDTETMILIEKNAYLLSIGINNVVTLYDPEIVIINSSIYRAIPEMVELVKVHMNGYFSKDIMICNSPLEDKATLYGCTAINGQHFLNVQRLKFNEKI